MNLQEYSEKAITTAIYPNQGNNLPYTILGLIEETLEFNEVYEGSIPTEEDLKVRLVKEAGDVYWYINATCSELGLNFETVANVEFLIDNLDGHPEDILSQILVLSGKTKKYIRDDNGVIAYDKKCAIETAMKNILVYIIFYLEEFDITVEQIMQTNIDKLFSRKERGVLGGSGDNR